MAVYRRLYGFGHLQLTAKDWDQLQNPMLVLSMGLPYYLLCNNTWRAVMLSFLASYFTTVRMDKGKALHVCSQCLIIVVWMSITASGRLKQILIQQPKRFL